jgi:hypothetical protein
MLRLLTLACLFGLGQNLVAQETPTPLKPGDNLQTSFHPYNVTGPRQGDYHCLITEYDLDPVVMIFVRGVNLDPTTRSLLTQVEAIAAKNPASRFRGVLVILDEDLPEVLGATDTNDDKREELEQKAKDLAKDLGLERVVVCLAGKRIAELLALDKTAPVTVLVYHRLKVIKNVALPREALTPEKEKQLLELFREQFGVKVPS